MCPFSLSFLLSFCPLCQNSLLLIIRWLSYLRVILSASNLSSALSGPCVCISWCLPLPHCLPGDSLMPLSLSHAGLISLAVAVYSHPLNFIYRNLRWTLGALLARLLALSLPLSLMHTCAHTHTQNTQSHHHLWSTVCISPWKQPVQQRSHTAAHWFTACCCSEFVVGFGSAFLEVQV